MAKGKTRKRKVPSRLRSIIGANVKARAAVRFEKAPNIPVALASLAGFSKSTAQRIMDGKVGTSLEQIDALAKALDLQPYQLFVEALNATNPQVAKGAMPGEERAYGLADVKRVVSEAIKEILPAKR